jgi:hypothetical protein
VSRAENKPLLARTVAAKKAPLQWADKAAVDSALPNDFFRGVLFFCPIPVGGRGVRAVAVKRSGNRTRQICKVARIIACVLQFMLCRNAPPREEAVRLACGCAWWRCKVVGERQGGR